MTTLLLGHFAATACGHGNFLRFTPWYAYLKSTTVDGICTPQVTSINDIWLIVAAVIEMLIRIAALAAIGVIIYAGFQYQTSRGEPDKTHKARTTLINAVVGLVIAILSVSIINLIARSIG